MYCKNCGKELTNEEKFCSSCGKKQVNEKREFIHIDGINKSLHAFYISVITSPLLFIIRMLTQTTERRGISDGSWYTYDACVVPSNIQAIMIVILIISTLLNLALRKNIPSSEEGKKKITKALLFINIVFGVFITFMVFQRADF